MSSTEPTATAQPDPESCTVGEHDGTIEVMLPADVAAVRTARRYVHERWAALGENTLGDVELIVSELVANAVRHGRPEIVFRVRVAPFAIDIAVLDRGAGLPPERPVLPSDAASSGRGLVLVDQLSSRWGVEPHAEGVGKTVWASVRR